MASEDHQKDEHQGCPLRAVDRRLDDLHRQWHAAADSYFDPEAFRVAIQTAIQTLRTVTFILQSNKALIPDFDAWYAGWQERMRADALMRWMVDARNMIEKQGDLEAHSLIRAEIIASYLEEGPSIQVAASLFDGPLALLESIPSSVLGDHIWKNGVLRVERRWVENSLPDHELLDAVAIAYGRVAEVVADAHRQLGLPPPEATNVETGEVHGDELRRGRLPCMIGHADDRALTISLATGEPIELERVELPLKIEEAAKLEARYEVAPKDMYGPGESAEGTLRSLFATARKMFLKDGHHVTVMFFLRGALPVTLPVKLRSERAADRFLMMRKMAQEAVKHGADGIILLGEVWSAPADPKNPYLRPADSPDRKEFLRGVLVTQLGEPMEIVAEIVRPAEGGPQLDQERERNGGAHFSFAPFYEIWGKPIPQAWLDASPVSAAEKTQDEGS